MTAFLPMTATDLENLGYLDSLSSFDPEKTYLDIILVSGDAYVDHPSFGVAVIGRVLAANGYRVGIISQPDWHDPASVKGLGRPRLFFG
ncbi:hypothetical protein KKF84_20135, partial [Myxococcota bacterium]|nr:hypothetical protein [Myxococcota bacterium]